jgi:Undecaprenyl-phosphate glucose phosphotransferase
LGLIGLADSLCIFGAGFLIFSRYVGWEDAEANQLYITALAVATVATILAFNLCNLYKFEILTHPAEHIKRMALTYAMIFLALVTIAFALKTATQFSRVWAFTWFFTAAFLIFLERGACYLLLHRWGRTRRLTRNIVIVGIGEQAKRLLEHLDRADEPWNLVVGVFDDRANRTDSKLVDHSVMGTVDDLLVYAREHRVDDVIISLPWCEERRIHKIAARLKELPVDVHLGSDLIAFAYPHESHNFLGGVRVLNVASKPLSGWRMVIKSLEDQILAAILLILLSPLMLLIAVAIRLDSRGPVIFRQPRYGFNNKVFSVFKFRTMYHGRAPDPNVLQATRNDPRVTRVGKWLRRLSLDELPQLFNVLQGSMSLVGPRPHAVPHNEEYATLISGYFARHRVKPGITGWAQVNGLRGETEIPEKMIARVHHDIYYIEHWSLLFDLQILAITALVVLSKDAAY